MYTALCEGLHMIYRYLDICFQDLVGQLWMINEHLLLSHLLNGVVSIALHGVVVLVDLDSKLATGGKVVRLGKMTQTMMLHCLEKKKYFTVVALILSIIEVSKLVDLIND